MATQGKHRGAARNQAQKEGTKRRKPQASVAVKSDSAATMQDAAAALRRTQLAVFQHFARAMTLRAGGAKGDVKGDGKGDSRVSPGEFGVLVLVEANPGINQTSLAKAVGADRSTMVPIIDRLERRGLLERQAMPGDRRAHALRLAKSGQERMRRFRQTVIEHEKRIAAGLSAAERAVLLDLLRRLRQAGEES
jgi:DNA-binding MarR family transcriptional regulator